MGVVTSASFRFSTDILRRLGEELVTSFDQGIVELVKNSYDADARTCRVELIATRSPDGTAIITDDGDGMTGDDIRDGWLVLGRSRKAPLMRTRRRRLPAGSKGLGRLGALRMGGEVLLVTRPFNEPGVEYSLCLRWSDFEQRDVVEDVELDIQRSDSESQPGSRIVISGLKRATTQQEVRKLARELVLLADPFGDPSGFRPELIVPEFKGLESLVRKAYFDDCEFRLVAHLDERGSASAQVFGRSGSLLWASEDGEFDTHYRAPAAIFELWAFLLHGTSFADRSATVGEVRRWLEQVGGVHLYHRGLRVLPYGDPGHDWLSMNLHRVRDPELRPSTNTSVGRVVVVDEKGELLQRTDRTGFIENDSFTDLRRFATDALEWMHRKRVDEREERRAKKKRASEKRAERAQTKLRKEIDRLAPEAQPAIKNATNELESARDSERILLREELALYKTLASVGTAVSVFAHEIEGPVSSLTVSVRAIERRVRKALAADYESTVGSQIKAVIGSAELIARFTTLPLKMLKQSKRRRTILDVNETVQAAVELLHPYLTDARVETTCSWSDESARVHGSVADIEAIVSNLLTNAVKALKRTDAPPRPRQIIVRTTAVDRHVLISVLDSGPGVQARLGDRIWLPGVTSDENGTGLGLTIVRDTVEDLGGRTQVVLQGELGGAEFIIELPRAGSEN